MAVDEARLKGFFTQGLTWFLPGFGVNTVLAHTVASVHDPMQQECAGRPSLTLTIPLTPLVSVS